MENYQTAVIRYIIDRQYNCKSFSLFCIDTKLNDVALSIYKVQPFYNVF